MNVKMYYVYADNVCRLITHDKKKAQELVEKYKEFGYNSEYKEKEWNG